MEADTAAAGSTCQVAGSIHPEEVRSCQSVGRREAEERRRSSRLERRCSNPLEHRVRVYRRTMMRAVADSSEAGN